MNQALTPAGYTRIQEIHDSHNPHHPGDLAPANFLHCAIFMPGGRVLGSETFRLVSFSGQDGASELFDYQLELHGNTSAEHGALLEFEDLIGQPLTVGIQRPALHDPSYPLDPGYDNDEMVLRFQQALAGGGLFPDLALFNGMIASFAMEQRGVYRVSMKPAVHRLTLTNQYRVYPVQSALDVVSGLLQDHAIAAKLDALSDAGNPFGNRRQHWLQAGESDFDFIRRLLSKAHVYFYFMHDGASHTMVFANRPAYPQVYPDGRPLRYTYTSTDELGQSQPDVISQYNYQCALTSSSVRGVFARQISCWEDDPIPRLHSYSGATSVSPGELPFVQYKSFQYGGSVNEADQYAEATGNSMQAAAQVFSGTSSCAEFRSGHQFLVHGEVETSRQPVAVRPALDQQRFVLTQVRHQASADGAYQNQFQSCPAGGLIAAFSIQETQQGNVLAEVVAPPGEVPSNWRYYIDNCYAYDTIPLSDPDELVKAPAVYVRLATDAPDAAPSLIKLAPHMQTVPEPGVTVLVSRAQDESELPEIQSIIHTNGSKVVMPSGWTANSHVGSSYNTSYGDGMSIRFGSSSQQQLDFAITRVNAAYDTKKYRETSYAQGASYGYNCADQVAPAASDDAELFGKYPGASDILSASESFGSNYSRHHAQVVSSYSKIGTMYNVSVTGLSESHSTVTGKTTSTALHEDDVSSTTTMNADSSNVATHMGDVDSVSSHLGDVSSINTILGSSVNVSTIVGVNASMSNHGVVLSNNNTLVQGSVNLTGVTGAMNSTGVSTHSNDTLVSIGDNFTGVQSDTTVIGAQSTTSTVLAQSTMNWVGASSTINLEGPGIHYNNKAEKVGAATQDIDVITIVVMQIYL